MRQTYKSAILAHPLDVILLSFAGMAALAYLFIPTQLNENFAPFIKAMPIWILAGLALINRDVPSHKRLALALVFSGFGDLFLSLDFSGNFAAGMGAFLLAQLAYISCFWPGRHSFAMLSTSKKMAAGMVLLWALALGLWLLPLAGKLAPALAVYFGALTLMVLLALGNTVSNIAKIGALLFLLSDTLIGIDRFATVLPSRHLAVMGSYYLAQAMLFWGLMQTVTDKKI